MNYSGNYSVATLADRWQCSRQHVYGMINRGELRAFKLGAKLFRIPAEEVEKCEALPSSENIEASFAPSITKTERADAMRLARLTGNKPK